MMREVMGSRSKGGGEWGMRVAVSRSRVLLVEGVEEEEEQEEGKRKGRRGVVGRGAACGAERSAESALSWISDRSCTRS